MMMDLDDDEGPLKMDDGEDGGGSPGGSDDYVLPRPPSPGGLQRTFTPVDHYDTYSPLPPLAPSSSSHHHGGNGGGGGGGGGGLLGNYGKGGGGYHLPHPAASPFPSTKSHNPSYSSSMGPPPAPIRGSGSRELKRGYAMQGGSGGGGGGGGCGYFPDDSPSDVMAFPPPTPYKGSHPSHAPPSVGKHSTPSSLLSHHHHHHHHHQNQYQQQQQQQQQHSSSSSSSGSSSSSRRNSSTSSTTSRFQADFDVVRVIGSGSFGEVYQARSRVDGVEYAVKCTRRRFKGQADRDRYLQEVKALAKVCAADSSEEVLHVVRYHQAWIEDERLFMQTELCEESLEQAMMEGRPGGRMGLEEVFDFGRQMLLALDVLHRHGLVHLDVKPANIFLKAGLYKLGDFGLVASVNSSDGLGDCLQEGDSRYMSAELLQDGPKDLTKCDIFSLGATVYEICRGRPLPPNGEEWHVLRSGTLPMLDFGGSEAGGELMRVLTQMMARDPSQRPSAAVLLTHPRLRSRLERELLKEKMKSKNLAKALVQNQQQQSKGRKLERTQTY